MTDICPGRLLLLLEVIEQRGYESWLSSESQDSLHLTRCWRVRALSQLPT